MGKRGDREVRLKYDPDKEYMPDLKNITFGKYIKYLRCFLSLAEIAAEYDITIQKVNGILKSA